MNDSMNFIEYLQETGFTPEKKGLSWWMSCPFHKDDTPSLQITPKKSSFVWYCFSCKRGGGPASFIAEHQGIPDHEARRTWARVSGAEPPNSERETLTRIVESMALAGGHPFLRGRGILDETARQYRIGYCESYEDLLLREGLDKYTAKSIGLFDFSGCLIYPFYDSEGVYKVAARSVAEKSYNTSDKLAKWFHEGWWGWWAIRGKVDHVWGFEGYHDCMAAKQAGYPALAAAGTNVSEPMWEELRVRGIKRITVVPDGDAGGRSWLDRLSEEAPSDIAVEFVVLPHGDPDDCLANGTMQGIKSIVPFEWAISKHDLSSLSGKIWAIRSTAKAWARMPRDHKALCHEWFAQKFGDDEALDYLNVDVEPDYKSERTVLANCLYSTSIRLESVQELEAWHFHGKQNQQAWTLIREKEVSPQMLQVELGMDLSDAVDIVNYKYYLNRVKESGTRAKVSKILASADPSNVGEIVEELYGVVDKVKISDSDVLSSTVIDDINDRVQNPGVRGLTMTRYPILNKAMLGLAPKRLILVSGNSGHGKTTMACNILDELIDDHETLFVSLEMADTDILEKFICIRSQIPSMKIATGSLGQQEYEAVVDAAGSISRSKLQIVGGVNDLFKLVALIKAHIMKRKTRIVAIDYIQLISVATREERWEQLARITTTLKTQICPLGPTVLAISQLKRSSLNSDVPDAADQAGAYAMLADADAAMTVRKVNPDDTKDGSNFMLHLSKNRFGLDSIVIPALFDRQTQRITEI